MTKPLLIVGGGIAGLTLGAAFQKLNVPYLILEQSEKIEPLGSGLSLMSNAVIALEKIGLDKEIIDNAKIMTDFYVKTQDEKPIFYSDFKKIAKSVGQPSLLIHRGKLQEKLKALIPKDKIVLAKKIKEMSQSENEVILVTENGETFTTPFVFGCDGVRSKIRAHLNLTMDLKSCGFQSYLGITQHDGTNLKKGNVIHYWGKGMRVGLIDLKDNELYWWVTINHTLEKKSLNEHLKNWPKYIQDIVNQTQKEKIIEVESFDRPVTHPWGKGRVTLLGDAAHAMLTSLGQGAGLAIEDAVSLALHFAQDPSVNSLRKYENIRFNRAKKVVKLTRLVATYEQFESPVKIFFRNSFFRLLPQFAIDNQSISLLKSPTL